ncbi:MAG: hypothetical protein U0641_05775 [Anaerolineae bacterium]
MATVVFSPYTEDELQRQKAAEEMARRYEEERQREREARMKLQDEMHDLMKYVAEKMGEEYGVQPSYEHSWCAGGAVVGVRSHGLFFNAYPDDFSGKQYRGKISIFLTWGMDSDKAYFRDDVVKEIAVSRSKGKEKIWKDIERRLLPSYRECREIVRASVRKEIDREAALKEMARRVAETTGGTYKAHPWSNGASNKYEWYIEGPNLPYTYNGPHVSSSNIYCFMNEEVERKVHLEIDFKDFDEALEVLALLACQVQQHEVEETVAELKKRKSA